MGPPGVFPPSERTQENPKVSFPEAETPKAPGPVPRCTERIARGGNPVQPSGVPNQGKSGYASPVLRKCKQTRAKKNVHMPSPSSDSSSDKVVNFVPAPPPEAMPRPIGRSRK